MYKAPDAGRYRVACFCQRCHWHVDITVTHKGKSCPQGNSPVHHFVDFQTTVPDAEYYYARCSSCNTDLHIEYRPARLSKQYVDKLTDYTLLQNRLDKARAADPDRVQLKAAKAVEVLDAFSCYIRDSLNPVAAHRAVPRLNRRFLLSFGDDCDDLLLSVGFVKTDDHWQLPTPPDPDPFSYDDRKLLEDIQEEIWAHMRAHMQSSTEMSKLRGYVEKSQDSEADLQLLLGTIEYDKTRTTRRVSFLSQDEETWYGGLGALGDFSDTLLRFAFDRQVEFDYYGMPFYFDCFTAIADKRGTEAMIMEKVMLVSANYYYGREEIAKAYQYFTIDPRLAHTLTDDQIRGQFETRLSSSGIWQNQEIRDKLKIIAHARRSKELEDTAANGRFDSHIFQCKFLFVCAC
jgi:ubiquitin carboxyl-terminal hydrolase 25/28